uniref:F-box domain-containing protein n=1 Tax=Steinernema glaseri TaxID=37863 RepID=A0A1I7YBG4_9BILA
MPPRDFAMPREHSGPYMGGFLHSGAFSQRLQMDSVPIAFVDALCITLEIDDLEKLQKLRRPWSSTPEKHCGKRRDFGLHLNVNHDGTQVGVMLSGYPNVTCASLSKHDRIGYITVGSSKFADLPEKMTLHRFRKKILPLVTSLTSSYALDMRYSERSQKELRKSLCSSLHGYIFHLTTGYTGGRCIEFLEKQIGFGYLSILRLTGEEWPDSMKSTMHTFLKSPNFMSLEIRGTNLTIDFDMATCFIEGFFKRDFAMYSSLCGKPSFDVEMLEDFYPDFRVYYSYCEGRYDLDGMVWDTPESGTLYAYFEGGELTLSSFS